MLVQLLLHLSQMVRPRSIITPLVPDLARIWTPYRHRDQNGSFSKILLCGDALFHTWILHWPHPGSTVDTHYGHSHASLHGHWDLQAFRQMWQMLYKSLRETRWLISWRRGKP